MEDYIKTKNIISNVCNQSGLSAVELCGVLSECLAELRMIMLNDAIAENIQLKNNTENVSEE